MIAFLVFVAPACAVRVMKGFSVAFTAEAWYNKGAQAYGLFRVKQNESSARQAY